MSATLHQATAVAIAGRAVLIEGPPGSGKSSLALGLIDRGAVLIGDDGVALERAGERLLASPAPATTGKLEVRNLGLLDFPTAKRVPVALIIELDLAAERWVEGPDRCCRLGAALAVLRLHPSGPILPLKVELALGLVGSGTPPAGER